MKQAAFYESVHDKEQPVRFFRGENGITLPHFHRCIEMLYITEGRVLGVVDGERFYAEKDDVIFVRRCAVHELTPSPAYKDYVLIIKAQYEDDFAPLLLARELDNKPARLDGGKALLRPSLPYDDVLRQETFFLDLYISGRYAPEPMVPGCVCLATSISGTVLLHAEGQDFQLLERDALRFAADQPFWLENHFNTTARLLLTYRYLK